jgi:hypothetical protein
MAEANNNRKLAKHVRIQSRLTISFSAEEEKGKRSVFTYAVNAVTFICWRHALALKHMTEMTIAVGAKNLDAPHAKRGISDSVDCTFVALIERRPAAAAFKFRFSRVQRRLARAANEMSFGRVETVVLTSRRRFGAFLAKHLKLVGLQHLLPVIVSHLLHRLWEVSCGVCHHAQRAHRQRLSGATGKVTRGGNERSRRDRVGSGKGKAANCSGSTKRG